MTWDEAVALFEERGLSEEIWQNLYEGEYVLHTGSADIDGGFPLNDGEDHPWEEERDIGYIVDGDLTLSGPLYDFDDGAAALVVLGNLKVKALHTTCDSKIIVTGHTTAEVIYAEYSDKYLVFAGDLRATVQLWLSESTPDHIGGTFAGSLVHMGYDRDYPIEAGKVELSPVPFSELLVPEVLEDGEVDSEALLDRMTSGEPLLRS
ncbi:hypothetical protein CLV40_110244 [Actinokineospora auranticolor]|uniref:Uncharacterized protein n=1 Tax=Actinokineospora auranticolor TaxID=155976 RepID=A0A2S6GMX8_9PSEU|nr:hypothetical protein CLV40_110244 [Actinokineospora auranticolor]